MQVEVRHAPAFAVARLVLGPHEEAAVEAGGMVAYHPGVQLRSRAAGGIVRSWLRKRLGGETFFMNFYRADGAGGWVDVAPLLPGDVTVLTIDPSREWIVQKGAWLAASGEVTVDPSWGGFKTLFGSEGLFLQRVSGSGLAVVSSYGAMDRWSLGPEEAVRVGSEHMVAYETTVQMQLRTASGSLVHTLKSGERFVFEFTGPGQLLVQSRNPQEFLALVSAAGSAEPTATPYRRVGSIDARQGGR